LAKLRSKLQATEDAEVPSGAILDASFFERDTRVVARDLLGKLLVREFDGRRLWGRLIEVEAYLGPDDLAAHSKGGRRTPRTEVMFGAPGHAYVYFTYGMHWCLNFVTREAGMPQAVLVRALDPGPGVGRCGGPGLLTRALGIDRALNGLPLRPPDLYVLDDQAPRGRVFVTPRIGVQGTGRWEKRLLRYCLDSPYLSRPIPKSRKGPYIREREQRRLPRGTAAGSAHLRGPLRGA
jgi:DNA-3-methyladenine glycosylase